MREEPQSAAVCVRCGHFFDLHVDEAWKAVGTECECCQSGEFIGEAMPLDDLLPEDPRG